MLAFDTAVVHLLAALNKRDMKVHPDFPEHRLKDPSARLS